MDSNSVLATATVVLAVATLVLVCVTAYYAWQNHKMVDVLRRQADLTEKIERHGRADTQIMAAVLLKVGGPMYDRDRRTIALSVANEDASPVLTASLTIRASKDPAGPPSWLPPGGAAESWVALKNALMPGDSRWLTCQAADFFRVGEIAGNESPLWPGQLIFDVESVGFLGQGVLQRYEWPIPLSVRQVIRDPASDRPDRAKRRRSEAHSLRAGSDGRYDRSGLAHTTQEGRQWQQQRQSIPSTRGYTTLSITIWSSSRLASGRGRPRCHRSTRRSRPTWLGSKPPSRSSPSD